MPRRRAPNSEKSRKNNNVQKKIRKRELAKSSATTKTWQWRPLLFLLRKRLSRSMAGSALLVPYHHLSRSRARQGRHQLL